MRGATPIFLLALALAAPATAGAAAGPLHSHSETVWRGGHPVLVETHADPAEAMATGHGDAGPTSLPTTWCGVETGADDAASEVSPRDLHKIKAVEAVPADREASAEVRDGIQASVAQIVEHLARESGGRRSLRFDLGTQCGPRYVDILTLRLPRPADDYGAGACNTGPLFGDVERALPALGGPRNVILYAPTIDCAGVAGYAQAPSDDRPGDGNDANRGGYLAVTFQMTGRTALHEIAHNLGAVQMSAPHHDGTRHCWDNHDTLCYPYTRLLPRSPLRPCDLRESGIDPFDCGQDDYFSPDPAPGSYLDTHWNLYDSKFMCDVADCAPLPPPPPPPPAPEPPAAGTPHTPPAPPAGGPGSGTVTRPALDELPLRVGRSLGSARSAARARALRAKVSASRPITRLTLSLKRRGDLVARGKLRRLRGRGVVRLGLMTKRLRPGTYTLIAVGRVNGRELEVTRRVKLGK